MEAEINLVSLWLGIRRTLPLVVLVAVGLALAAYLWTRAQPVVYEASATVIASSSQSQIGVVGGAVVSPLPVGTVEEVLQSPLILRPLISAVQDNAAIAPAERLEIVANLKKELSAGQDDSRQNTVSVSAGQERGENSVYTLRARAPSANAARLLVDQTSALLLAWDAERTSRDVALAQTNFTLQLAQVDRRLALPGLSALERQTLVYRRATMQDNLAQLAFLESARTGSLKPLASAVNPVNPVTPSGLLIAVLLGVLGMVLGIGLAAVRTVMNPYVQTEHDLLALGLPVLGVIPRRRHRIGSIQRGDVAQEAIGFLRVRLLGTLRGNVQPVILVAGVTEKGVKRAGDVSCLVAQLATDMAQEGQRVLIVEARGQSQEPSLQHLLLNEGSIKPLWRPLGNVQVAEVREGIDLLPAAPHTVPGSGRAGGSDLGQSMRSWSEAYDVVLVDSPPLLDQVQGLTLGQQANGVLLVARAGQTSLSDLKSVLRSASAMELPLVGCVLNHSSAPLTQARRSPSWLGGAAGREARTEEMR